MTEEFDVIVIGSGPGGYVAAIRAAQLGLKTACIDKTALGGTCLNVGCIPSKTFLHATETYNKIKKHGQALGIEAQNLQFNFATLLQKKEQTVKTFNQGIAGLFRKNKVQLIKGLATFCDPHTIEVEKKTYTSKHFILATGSEPTPLPFLPFDEKKILSSTGALDLQEPPKKLLIVGAGIIGVELGSVYHRLGTEVCFVEFCDRICPTIEPSLAKELQKILEKEGFSFRLSSKVVAGKVENQRVSLEIETPQKKEIYRADAALVCIGRRPYTKGLNLEKIGIETTKKGLLFVNDHFQTTQAHIYAIGDLIEGPMLAHKASEEGIAVAEIISGKSPKLEYITIPNVIYTDPEVASVGLTEEEAKAYGLMPISATFPFLANSRAKCVHEEQGFVKLIADQKSQKLLGGHIIGAHAGELIEEIALALKLRATAQEIAETSHAHPTLSEAIKEAALGLCKQMLHI